LGCADWHERCYSSLRNSSREILDCLRISRTSRTGRSPECTATVVRRPGSSLCTRIVMASLDAPRFKSCPAKSGKHLPRFYLRYPAHAGVSFTGTTSLIIVCGSVSDAGIQSSLIPINFKEQLKCLARGRAGLFKSPSVRNQLRKRRTSHRISSTTRPHHRSLASAAGRICPCLLARAFSGPHRSLAKSLSCEIRTYRCQHPSLDCRPLKSPGALRACRGFFLSAPRKTELACDHP